MGRITEKTKKVIDNVNGQSKEVQVCFLERVCVQMVRILMGAILVFLAVMSAFVTCTVYGGAETVEYLPDWPLFHLFLLAAVLAALVILQRRTRAGEWHLTEEKYRRILFIAAGCFVIWLMITLYWPGSDQRLTMESAYSLLNGDYSPWEPIGFVYGTKLPIGYAFTYPSQNGLILFLAAVMFIFRDITPYAIQVLNIGFLILGMIYLCRLMEQVFSLKRTKELTITMIVCLPFSFYITFVYGTMPGFALSCAALYYEYCFIKTRAWKYFWISAVSVAVSVLLKSNYLIVLTAMEIYYLSESVFRRKIHLAAAAVLLIVVYAAGGRGANLYLEAVTSRPVSGGIPMTAWVEMGLQEGSRAPGWYNGYNVRVFAENGEDTEKTKTAIREDLKDTLEEFAEDPEDAAGFFLRKTESQWAEPTFQSLWIQEVKGGSWLLPQLTDSLLKEGGLLNMIYLSVCNWFQTLIYTGAFLFVLLWGKRMRWEQLIPGIIFIGGFLFHMAWEAKGQYTICYFILLIPYAYAGISRAVSRLTELFYHTSPDYKE